MFCWKIPNFGCMTNVWWVPFSTAVRLASLASSAPSTLVLGTRPDTASSFHPSAASLVSFATVLWLSKV